jgi:ribonuclease D
MWERLRPRSNNRRYLGMLRAIAAWREREVQRVNIPRQRLLKDETLLELAATMPTNVDELARARGVSRGFAEGRSGASLLAAISQAKLLPDDAMPVISSSRDAPRASPALVSLLKVLLAAKCEQHHVAPKLVASSADIDRLATEDAPDIPALHGWRLEVFGADAAALKAGSLALGVAGKRVKMIRTDR